MEPKVVKIKEVKSNPNNPRFIKDSKFEKLVKSIKEFPQMLMLRPIIVNNDMMVLGGNMRLKACIEAGMKEIPIMIANNLTEEQEQEFIIKDNVGFGEWDWDMLANTWDNVILEDWGMDIFSKDLFDIDDTKEEEREPRATDDDYSTYELIMLHENKLVLLETINKVKTEYLFETQEQALMEIIRVYNNK